MDQPAASEPVQILCHGKPVAEIAGIDRPRKAVLLEALTSATDGTLTTAS